MFYLVVLRVYLIRILCNQLREGNLIFVVQAVGRIISGRSVGKIIILSFRVSTSKNKNADHWVKEICAIRSIQVIYETNHISLLHESKKSNALNFRFFYIFYCNLKEKDHIWTITYSKKKEIHVKSVLLLFWFTKN